MKREEFSLRKYRNSETYKDFKYRSLLERFFEFLDINYEENGDVDSAYFELFEKEQFLDSIMYYIEKMSPAKQTATDYKRAVEKFFEMLYKEYGIRNAVMFNNESKDAYNRACKQIIEQLPSKSTQPLSNNDYDKLCRDINTFLATPQLREKIFEEIEQNTYRSKYCKKFISILPIKLAMHYGLKSGVIANIQLSDYNKDNHRLYVNGFELLLDDDLNNLFLLYLEFRKQIVANTHVDSNFLFIQQDGNSFLNQNGNSNSERLSYFAKYSLGSNPMQEIAYKCIVEQVKKGDNILALVKLTGMSIATIGELFEHRSIEFEREDLSNLLKIQGLIRCPFCGRKMEALADNWILVQIDGQTEKYLSCRKCKGKNGKYMY